MVNKNVGMGTGRLPSGFHRWNGGAGAVHIAGGRGQRDATARLRGNINRVSTNNKTNGITKVSMLIFLFHFYV